MSLSGHRLQELPGNDRCVDCQDCDCERCGIPDPIWASEELGIVVCEDCMAIHQSLTKATFKSVLCQDWTEESLNKLLATNNNASKEIYEKNLPIAYRKPTRCFERTFREQWVISKYVRQDFAAGPHRQPKYLIGEKKGYMWKRGRDDRIFQRRWFMLDISGTGLLKYYIDSHATPNAKRGEIPLSDLVISPASEDKIGHPNGLQLMYPETNKNETSVRIIYIYAEAPKDMVEWYQSIRCLTYILTKKRNPKLDDKMILQQMSAEVVKEGYLMKTGSSGKGAFRKRWFILDNEKLMYFRKQLDANPISSIMLGSHTAGYSIIQSKGDDGWHFYLKTPGRTYHLIAEEDSGRQSWIKAIHRVCMRLANIQQDQNANTKKTAQATVPATTFKPISAPSTPGSSVPTSPVLLGSSATLPLPSIPRPKQEELTRSPTVPPRPFIHVPDSLKSHERHLELDSSNKRFQDARNHPHQPRIFVNPSAAGEETAGKDQDDVDSAESDGENGYITHAELLQAMTDKRENGAASPVISFHSDDDADNLSDKEDDDLYMEFVGEKVVCTNKFTNYGGFYKELSLHISLAPQSLPEGDKSTLSLSIVWSALPSLPGDTGCVILCPVVSCTSFPTDLDLLKPFSLEIQHCGVLKDVHTCKPKLWCMRSVPGQMLSWEEIQDSDSKISYRIKERCVIIETKDVSVFAVKVPKDDIVGKTIRCVTYTSGDSEGSLNARVYFINDNGSDDALQEIKRNEQMCESMLCDISHKFFLSNNKDGILMSVENLHGLQNFDGSSDIIQVSAEDLWDKHIAVYNLELQQTALEGFCTLKVWQENNPREKLPIDLTLRTDNTKDYMFIPAQPVAQAEYVPPALPAHEIDEPQEPLTRVSTAPVGGREKQEGGLDRHNPNQRSAPARNFDSAEEEELGILPYSLKRNLFLLLDSHDQQGNDWRMLANKLGLGALIVHIETKVNPTLEVLRYFETMERSVSELEEHLRDMHRSDAADVVRKFIDESATQDQEEEQQ